MDLFFGQFGGLVTIAMLVQLALVVLLIIVLVDLRAFLREGTGLMRRVDRFLMNKEHSD